MVSTIFKNVFSLAQEGPFWFRLLFKLNIYLFACYNLFLYVFFIIFFSIFAEKAYHMFGKVLNTPLIILPELVPMRTLPMFDETVHIKTLYK